MDSQKTGITHFRPTRFANKDAGQLGYTQWGKDWRLVHRDPPSGDAFVGPIYRSKAELLADLDRYAKEFGF